MTFKKNPNYKEPNLPYGVKRAQFGFICTLCDNKRMNRKTAENHNCEKSRQLIANRSKNIKSPIGGFHTQGNVIY